MASDAKIVESTAGEPAARVAPFVVGVGASAGGLQALRTLFGSMPDNSGASFVVVMHRSPHHDSRLVELLQPYTQLPVREVDGEMPLQANCIFLLSPTAGIEAVDTHIRPARAAVHSGERTRIDELFKALAASHGARSVGVILTGAGSDGALGLRHLKDNGGLVIVQDPDEAEYDGMPRSALESGVVDLVLPLREIADAIGRYRGADSELSPFDLGADIKTGVLELQELLALLEARTGADFSIYQSGLLMRRVAKRMRLRAIVGLPEYLRLLATDAAETVALAADLRLNVTEFFRDGETFRRLRVEVLPQLFDLKRSDADAVRAWCCGCGMGEEAYSVAIELLEACDRRELQPRLRLFATDPSEDLLQRARLGFYPAEIAEAVPRARLERYFLRDEHGYRVRPQLRKLVTFANHEVFKDFPFSRLDLIVCRRGLLSDLKPAVRRAVVQSFHFALEPHGFLVVSPDDAFEEPRLFTASGEGGHVYRRLDAPRRPLRIPALKPAAPLQLREEHPFERSPWPDPRVLHLDLLERYLPASVLVDADGNVIYYSANAGRYLRMPGGEVRHQLLRMLREPVRAVVQSGLETAGRDGTAWVSDTLIVRTPGGARRIVVHVDPAGPDCPVIDAKLVVFEEFGEAEAGRDANADKTPVDFTMLLGSELDDASQRLRAMVSDERRHAAEPAEIEHEESELAGIVEDLETAKEELQTVNEELFALNRENRSRLEELARLSTDLEVLLESTGVATLFLDGELRVIRFTPPLLDIFNVLPADQGRPFADLQHRLRDHDLLDDARRVLKHLTPVDREVEGENGKWYLLRMLPYRTLPHAIAGVAISFVDITSRKRAEQRLRDADRRKDEFIALLAHELRNPLAPISAGIEILKRSDLDPAVAERVTATMARQAAQLVRLIDDLLEVSRVTSGRLRLRKTPVAVADIVRDAVAAVRPLIDRSGQQLAVLTPTQPILLDADAARLTQVLANLLNNAARYTPSGGEIGVTVRQDGEHVMIAVKDTGYGIAADALPHVFEMFYQGKDARASPQAGLGIGLALAKSLVEMHAGTIAVKSAGVDRGSVFTLRLPALAVGASLEPTRREPAGAALGGHRVLVVDDNADAAQTLAFLIRALGENEVHVAHSGAEALPLAARVKPDTVFLDLKMPEMDGYEVAQRLRGEPWGNDAWLVALTGWGLEEHKRRTKDAGFDQHLTKPADRAALEGILARNNRASV